MKPWGSHPSPLAALNTYRVGSRKGKMPVGWRGEASWRCDRMKSHFPLVTQQATTELWSGKAPTCKLSPCPRCLCPCSPPSAPTHPFSWEKTAVGTGG